MFHESPASRNGRGRARGDLSSGDGEGKSYPKDDPRVTPRESLRVGSLASDDQEIAVVDVEALADLGEGDFAAFFAAVRIGQENAFVLVIDHTVAIVLGVAADVEGRGRELAGQKPGKHCVIEMEDVVVWAGSP